MTTTTCHGNPGGALAPKGSPIVALVGAPNSGKSTLFNALTGARAQTGNWPGTTVEISRGAWRLGTDAQADVIDFPGAYSLEPLSPDEALTREMLLDAPPCHRPDLVIVAVDATAVARGLNIAFQLAGEPYRIIVALTKLDVAEARGLRVDADALAAATGLPVVAVDPRRRDGMSRVRAAVNAALASSPEALRPDDTPDQRFIDLDAAARAAVTQDHEVTTFTQRLDKVALHPVAGPLLFMAAMWLIFQITTTVAGPLQDGLEALVSGPVSGAVTATLGALGWDHPLVTGLIVDGLVGGVGMVLTFAPLMALMFICLAVLEDSGYMARAAVVTDRVMRAIGLPGKAFIPIVVGFGCNVPAISATRVLGTPRHRILTCLLIPFTSCSARLVVFVMLATTFFPAHAGSVVFAMYVISIALVVLTGLLLRHTLWRTMPYEPLVIDLPTYQVPTPRLALAVTWTRLKGFLRTAGGIIVATVVVVWTLMALPVSAAQLNEASAGELAVEDSAYGALADAAAPIFAPAGFDSWSLTGPLVTGFVAKEALISTWAQTYSVDDVTDAEPDEQARSSLSEHVRADFDAASGGHARAAVWAYMLFLLAYTPCVATLAAQRREIGWRWTLFGFGVQLALAWTLSVAAFQILRLWF
ncbi:ferrous iron transport protein B [Corynebacterium confusum]